MRRGLATSRHEAAELVARGMVRVGGAVADKPARLVAPADPVVVDPVAPRYVSRGGEKLDAALARFAVSVTGRRCLDAGCSTGGFTDCLLQRGAAHVVAVDVAHGALDARLRAKTRVTLLERTNVRHLDLAAAGGARFDVVVADLSFISLTVVTGVLASSLPAPGADLVLLVKPQFEVERAVASRGRGVVRDPAERLGALARVASALTSAGAVVNGAMASPLLGPAGNAEFFIHASAHATAADAHALQPERDPGASPRSLSGMLDAAVAESPDLHAPGRRAPSSQTRTPRAEACTGLAGTVGDIGRARTRAIPR